MAEQIARLDPASRQSDPYKRVTATLVRAFLQDPLKIRLAPDYQGRERMLYWLLGGVVRYCLVYGEVYTNADVSGAACWLPPGYAHLRLWGSLRAWGLLPGTLGAMPPNRLWLSLQMQSFIEKQHERCMPGPHWYLFLLGVSPERQGQGVGSSLIEPVLRRASLDGLPCYLETQTSQNVSFYQKHGFTVVDQGEPRGLGMPLWFMTRMP